MCGASKYFVDFIERCLVWYPEFRISPEDALMHNFVICEMDYDELCLHKQKIKRIQRGDYESRVSKGNCGGKMYTNITGSVMIGNGRNKRSSYSYEKKKMMVFHKGLKRKRNSDNDNNACGNNTSNLYAIPSARGKEGSCNGNYMKINKIKNKK
jgi:serine/threonine protein kinase